MRTLDDFTVGWICRLATGFVTARSLLDEVYETPQMPSGDYNEYVFGRIAQHHVFIALLLPSLHHMGRDGASVASRLLRTFRNLEFALLVGTGGGAPSRNHDVRLGDVVVSRPGRGHRAVIQYDLGKRTAVGPLASTDAAYNNPPGILLSALAKLQAQHLIYKPMYMDYLSALSATDIRFEHPGVQYDNLYQSACAHRLDHDDCSRCDQMVDRQPRDSTAPQVHYGLIASSYHILKDAGVRDQLTQKLGVLCFEGEVADLTDHLPCLVIKGIADYADSHKNERWQYYAASTAAAYAKELLHYVNTDSLDIGESADADNASTSSATLVTDSDNELVQKAAAKVAAAFLSDKKFKALCTACIPRMTASGFQRNIIRILSHYGANMKKSSDTTLGQLVAFITAHRKGLISYIIQERIFPSRTESAERKLGTISEQEVKRLKQLIESRFPSYQYDDAHKARPNRAELEQKETDADAETDITDMPVSLTETDLENINNIVCTGEPYREAYKELQLVAFPDPVQELRRVLQTHIPDNGSQYVINCMVQWEILELMESEEMTETDLDSFLTLTGTFGRASVCRLGSYMHQRWGSGGAALGVLKELLALYLTECRHETQPEQITMELAPGHGFHIQMVSLDGGNEQAMLQVRGTFCQILETLEQFSWLIATLRPCQRGELTVSEVKAEIFGSKLFGLSLLKQTAHRKPDPREAGQCWTSLFTESNLAYGFELCSHDRPDEMLGLEIPVEVMAAFARVEYPIVFEDQKLLAGKSTLLTPVISSADCIQWHYAEGENRFESCRQHTKVLDSKLQTMDWRELTSARAFLGFASNVEIHLGTKYVPGAEIGGSRVPKMRDGLGILKEGPVGMEVGFKGFFKATLGGTWKVRKGEQAQIQGEHRSLIDYIQPARYAPVLLYDYEAARAFLVPELSIILHMVSAYLRSCSTLPEDQIPCAQPSSNSGEAAFRVIEEKQELIVPFKIGDSRRYRDIVHDFIHIWEQRRSQTSAAAQSELCFHFRTSIRGWDFVDMQNKQYEFSERAISATNLSRQSTPIWWEVFSKQPCMVIFGSNIGCPIRKIAHDNSQSFCNAWADLPTGKHLLLAQLSSLIQLSRTFFTRVSQNTGYHMITSELAWARPKGSILFDICTQGTGNGVSCTPVQTMRKVGGWHSWEKAHDRTPGDIAAHANGAALFADNPKDFAPRPCFFELPALPDPAPPNLALPHPGSLKEYHMSVIYCILAGCFCFVYIISLL